MADGPKMAIFFLLSLASFVSFGSACDSCNPRRPHIVYILADDAGWGDVSWHSSDMSTPNLESLKSMGVELTSHYTQPACSASRAALLTGRYPFTLGLHHSDMAQYHRWRNHSLPLGSRILPEYLRSEGYANHMIGKWQMGFCNWEYTPTRRGFDTFYGSYGGNSGHYSHEPDNDIGGYDFRNNLNVDQEARGQYSTELYTQRAVDIIRQHHDTADSRPLFLYLSYEAPHLPLQVPERYVNEYCSHVADPDRKTRCGMMAAVDEGVGKVMAALKDVGYSDNLLLVFTSDNGAPGQGAGSNLPLRGKKRTLYEGGVRVPAFIFASMNVLPKQPYSYHGVMHITDWLPTLLKAAGGKISPKKDAPTFVSGSGGPHVSVDGVSQWSSILGNRPSPRKHMVYDVYADGIGAIRKDNWKMVKDPSEKCAGWFHPLKDKDYPKKIPCATYELYDLNEDPNETLNIAYNNVDIVHELADLLNSYAGHVSEMPYAEDVAHSWPKYWGGSWSPGWCETSGAVIDFY